MRIAIIGGTGKEGRGLVERWARAGHGLSIGSRDGDKARAKAEELVASGAGDVWGGDNAAAVARAELAVLAVPYTAHGDTLRALAPSLSGKVLVDLTVPLQPPKVTEVHLPAGQAAALEAQAILDAGAPSGGPRARVVAALHHVSSVHLSDPAHPLDTDVLVCGDDAAAKEQVIGLVRDLGLRGVDAGGLRNAIALEALTAALLFINRRYKVQGAGVRITGLPG